MKASIIKIGNSQGVRIPKPIIEQCGFADEVELEVHNHALVIKPVGCGEARTASIEKPLSTAGKW